MIVGSEFDGVTAAILAGGLGTRLRAVVADRPKVLAPVGGRPFLTYLLDRLARAGVRETVLLVGYGADRVRAAVGGEYAGMRLIFSEEREPLGTGGALRLALPLFGPGACLVLNGDSYCDVDLAAFSRFQHERPPTPALVVAAVDDASRYGRVRLDAASRVECFEEKTGVSTPGTINAGVYLFPRDCIASIPAGRPHSLERDCLPTWLGQTGLRGYPGGKFIDIGTPESYATTEAFFRTTGSGATS